MRLSGRNKQDAVPSGKGDFRDFEDAFLRESTNGLPRDSEDTFLQESEKIFLQDYRKAAEKLHVTEEMRGRILGKLYETFDGEKKTGPDEEGTKDILRLMTPGAGEGKAEETKTAVLSSLRKHFLTRPLALTAAWVALFAVIVSGTVMLPWRFPYETLPANGSGSSETHRTPSDKPLTHGMTDGVSTDGGMENTGMTSVRSDITQDAGALVPLAESSRLPENETQDDHPPAPENAAEPSLEPTEEHPSPETQREAESPQESQAVTWKFLTTAEREESAPATDVESRPYQTEAQPTSPVSSSDLPLPQTEDPSLKSQESASVPLTEELAAEIGTHIFIPESGDVTSPIPHGEITEYDTLADLSSAVGFPLIELSGLPFPVRQVIYRKNSQDAEVVYRGENGILVLLQPAPGTDLFSLVTGDWQTVPAGRHTIFLKTLSPAQGGGVIRAVWESGGRCYILRFTPPLSAEAVTEIAAGL